MSRMHVIISILTLAGFANAATSNNSPIKVQDFGSQGVALQMEAAAPVDLLSRTASMQEGVYITDDGRSLPVISRFVAVPSGKTPSLSVHDLKSDRLNPQTLEVMTGSMRRDGEETPMVLDPPSAVVIGEPAIVRGVQVVPLAFYPLQSSTDDGSLVYNSQINAEINFEFSEDALQANPINDAAGTDGARMMDELLLNNTRRDPDENQIGHFGHILIMYQDSLFYVGSEFNEILYGNFSEFVTWKRQLGYKVSFETITLGEANANPTNIRETIRSYYFSEDPIQHLILLGADSSETTYFPTKSAAGGGEQGDIGGDHYYTLMDESDFDGAHAYASDITIGRFWAFNPSELRREFNRSILYEREPFVEDGDEWMTRGYYTAENIDVAGGQFVQSMTHLGRWIQSRFLNYGYDEFDTLFADVLGGSDAIKQRNLDYLDSEHGMGVVLSRGHVEGCYEPGVGSIDTYRKHPFMASITCLSAQYGIPFFVSADKNTMQNPSGPIAVLTIIDLTHTKSNNALLGWLTRGITYEQLNQPGVLHLYSKWQMWNDLKYAEGSIIDEIIPTLNSYLSLGDPTVQVFTRSPITLAGLHLETISPTATGFEVEVRDAQQNVVADAIVTLTDENGVQMTTNPGADGIARFTFEAGTFEADEVVLTISRVNAIPYFSTIAVEENASNIVMTGWSFDGDGVLERGETAKLTLMYENSGNQAAGDVTLSLVTENEELSFDQAEIDLGEIAAGADAEIEVDVTASANLHGLTYTRIGANFSGSEGLEWQHAFDFVPKGPRLSVARVDVADDDFERGANPELEISIRNLGDQVSPELSGTVEGVRKQQSRIVIEDAVLAYDSINPDEAGTPDAYLSVSIDQLAVPGDTSEFILYLTDSEENGYRDTLMFAIAIRQGGVNDPYGPDNYGYICFDNGDEDWIKAPTYDWIEINPVLDDRDFDGTDLGMLDLWEDTGDTTSTYTDTSVVVALPFEFSYYGEVFDSLTICTNGWMAFGAGNSKYYQARNWTLPGINAPDAMVAVFWQDLHQIDADDNSGVFTYYNEDESIFVIEWSLFHVYDNSANDEPLVEFQAILYDPDVYTTSTGDGEIKLQYKTVEYAEGVSSDNHYFTVGILNLDNTDGLEYAFWNHFAEQNADIAAETAILFTVDTDRKYGSLEGYVKDEATGLPIEGVTVSQNRGALEETTDAEGFFNFDALLTGFEVLTFEKFGYNTESVEYEIIEDETTEIDFRMTKPGIEVDANQISATIKPDFFGHKTLSISSTGNGPLDFELFHRYPDGSETSFAKTSETNLEDQMSVSFANGIEVVGDRIFVTVDTARSEDAKIIVEYDTDGNYQGMFNQSNQTRDGFYDLTWDGERFWAGENPSRVEATLVPFDIDGAADVTYDPFKLPEGANLIYPDVYLAWNPVEELLFVSADTGNVYSVKRTGEMVDSMRIYLPGEQTKIHGLSWNSSDNMLYAIDERGATNRMRVLKIDPYSGYAEEITVLGETANEVGRGIAFGYDLAHDITTVVTVNDDNHLKMFEFGPDSRWLRFEPQMGTIPAGESMDVMLEFNAHGLTHGDTFNLGMIVNNNSVEAEILIDVTLIVDNDAGIYDGNVSQPSRFFLAQAYPNPFNSQARIDFNLREAGMAKLQVYDLAGRLVGSLVEQDLSVGAHSATFDANRLPSGVYIYRLQSGGKTAVKRMVLVR
ncbi:C25 family cysteine peptidase [Calditrichota bacterium]